MKTKTLALTAILILILFSCKKKENKTEEPEASPVPIVEVYSTFSSTIAVVDYSAFVGVTIGYNLNASNLSMSSTAIAYIVAEGVKIDSLSLTINRLSAQTPTLSFDPCNEPWWSSYSQNYKNFKVKNNVTNSLDIYENGIKVFSFAIDVSSNDPHYMYQNGLLFIASNMEGYYCNDNKRIRLLQ